jgi:hypothetical protein
MKRLEHETEKFWNIIVRHVPSPVYWGMKRLMAKYEAKDWIELFEILTKKEGTYEDRK